MFIKILVYTERNLAYYVVLLRKMEEVVIYQDKVNIKR